MINFLFFNKTIKFIRKLFSPKQIKGREINSTDLINSITSENVNSINIFEFKNRLVEKLTEELKSTNHGN